MGELTALELLVVGLDLWSGIIQWNVSHFSMFQYILGTLHLHTQFLQNLTEKLSQMELFHKVVHMSECQHSKHRSYYHTLSVEEFQETSKVGCHKKFPWIPQFLLTTRNHIFLPSPILNMDYHLKQYVFKFDIPVNNIIHVKMLESLTNLPYDGFCQSLFNHFLFF